MSDKRIIKTKAGTEIPLSRVNGNDYLEVVWRVAWFREEFPAGQIETEAIEISADIAIFRATVRAIDADGAIVGSATGHGSETPGDFRDYVEKAETKAVGRALQNLGYGVEFAHLQAGDISPTGQTKQEQPRDNRGGGTISERQRRYIRELCETAGLDRDQVNGQVKQQHGADVKDLTSKQASEVIEWLQKQQPAAAGAGGR